MNQVQRILILVIDTVIVSHGGDWKSILQNTAAVYFLIGVLPPAAKDMWDIAVFIWRDN